MVSTGDACLPEGVGRLGDWEIGRLGDWEIGRLGAYVMFNHVGVEIWEPGSCLSVGRGAKPISSFALYILVMRCAVPRCMTPCAMP